MSESQEVLELLLSARYVGRPAFAAVNKDIATLIGHANSLAKVGAAFNLVGDAALVMGAAVASGVALSLKAVSDWEAAQSRLASSGFLTPGQLPAFQQTTGNIAAMYGLRQSDLVNAQYNAASLVAPTGQQLPANYMQWIAQFVTASAPKGAAGYVDVPTAGLQLAQLLVSQNQPVAQWQRDIATIAQVEKNSGVTTENLVAANQKLGRISGLNIDFASLESLLGVAATHGIQGSLAGTELTSGLAHIVTAPGEKALAALGLSPEQFERNGAFDMVGLLRAVTGKEAGMDPLQRYAENNSIFGQVGSKFFTPVLTQQGLAQEQTVYNAATNNPIAALQQQSLAATNNFESQFARLKAEMLNIFKPIDDALLPPFRHFVDFLIEQGNRLTSWLNSLPTGTRAKVLLGGVGGLLGGGLALKGAGGLLGLLGGEGLGAIDLAGIAAGGGILLGVVSALTVALFAITQFWPQIQTVAASIARNVLPPFQRLKEVVGGVWNGVVTAWEQNRPAIEAAASKFAAAFNRVAPIFGGLATIVSGYLSFVLQGAGKLASAFLTALPGILNFFTRIANNLGDFVHLLSDLLSGNWRQLPADVRRVFGGIASDIRDGFQNAQKAIQDATPHINDAITTLFNLLATKAIPAGEKLVEKALDHLPQFVFDVLPKIALAWGFIQLQFTKGFLNLQIAIIKSIPGLAAAWAKGMVQLDASIGQDILNLQAHLAKAMYDVGKNLIQGFIKGVTDNGGGAGNAVLQVLFPIPSLVAHFLGIRSPSTVFAELGKNTVLGFAQGVTGNKRAVTDALGIFSPSALAGAFRGPSANLDVALNVRTINAAQLNVTGHVSGLPTGGTTSSRPSSMLPTSYATALTVQQQRQATWNQYDNPAKKYDLSYRNAYQYTQ